MSNVFRLRGGYSESWTVFWITAHFLNAASEFERMGLDLDRVEESIAKTNTEDAPPRTACHPSRTATPRSKRRSWKCATASRSATATRSLSHREGTTWGSGGILCTRRRANGDRHTHDGATLLITIVAAACSQTWAERPEPAMNLIPSWGDITLVYGPGTDAAMDTPQAMENMVRHWKGRGFTGVYLRSTWASFRLVRSFAISQGPRQSGLGGVLEIVDEIMARADPHKTFAPPPTSWATTTG